MSKEITNEELAKMIKLGFDGQDKRFDGQDKRFDAHDKRFDAHDKRFDKIEQRLNTLEQGQEDIKLRLDNVAYRFELRDLEKTVKLLTFRIKKLEDKK